MPATIDLAYAGTENGVPVYAPPVGALTGHVLNGIAWLLVEHPHETLNVTLNALALASVAGACMWLVNDDGKQGKKKRAPRHCRPAR
jgi:hypothetical protein